MDNDGETHIDAPNSVFYNTINRYEPNPSTGRIINDENDFPFDLRLEYLSQYAVRRAYYLNAQRGAPLRCDPETRQAIILSLKAWRYDRTAKSVRWISGWAGTGKTTIARTMAEIWKKEGSLGATFFFSRSGQDANTALWLPVTIAFQLSKLFPFHELATALKGQIKRSYSTWDYYVVAPLCSVRPPQSLVIIIDGLDECHNPNEQVVLLRNILESTIYLGPSVKFLISCRPERHLEGVFDEFDLLNHPNRIRLGQSTQDKDDLRRFLQRSFRRICKDRRTDNAMSITDQSWPSAEQIEELVDRASGQFIFVATLMAFVDGDNEDPVKMLNLVLEHRLPSFEPIDALYLVILHKVENAVSSSPDLHELMRNILFHVDAEPSSSTDIARFWFTDKVKVNILVRQLRAVLCRQDADHGLIQFRHKSFHDFLARPSSPHPFSLANMNPISQFFLRLWSLTRKTSRSMDPRKLTGFQYLGYAFLHCDNHPPVLLDYEEKAERLYRRYVGNQPPNSNLRGCACLSLPQLRDFERTGVLKVFGSCEQYDCIIDADLLALCQMTAEATKRRVDLFIHGWKDKEIKRPTLYFQDSRVRSDSPSYPV
ncbi:hypothetical protein BDN72DRAFT_391575 [Pluteus cervinus]|uniref:Uncharacterized protein n=1 Tax=Pluteus cervinus TaxID=181527 RepID=A0ACD3A9N3_9AGAR|nr:hypothetical protein BDN72DRAFT_391575 [Pluteus cervinus]